MRVKCSFHRSLNLVHRCVPWRKKEFSSIWREQSVAGALHVIPLTHFKMTTEKPSSQSEDSSGSHVWMCELDHKVDWVPKNWCFWTVVLEKTLESPLDCKEIQPVHPKGDQSWIFIGGTEAETPILWPPDEELTHWKRPWCWQRLNAGGEGDDRGWAGWMASPTRWTWVWANPASWWRTGRPFYAKSQTSLSAWRATRNNRCESSQKPLKVLKRLVAVLTEKLREVLSKDRLCGLSLRRGNGLGRLISGVRF